MRPVKTLEELINILDPRPLRREELAELFVETGKARDSARSQRSRLARILSKKDHSKVLFTGHRGTGKSTELVKFCDDKQDEFIFVRLEMQVDYDLRRLTVEHLLLLIVEAVLRKADDLKIKIDDQLLEDVHAWFSTTFQKAETKIKSSATAKGGVSAKDSLWGALLGLIAELRLDVQAGVERVRSVETEEKRYLRDLADRCGELISQVELKIFEKHASYLILIVEDLDKAEIDVAEKIFADSPATFSSLPIRAVFTAPVFLIYSPLWAILDRHFMMVNMPMIQVNDREGKPYQDGREIIRKIIARRVDIDSCVDEDALSLAIEKTGGILRHLFSVLTAAAEAVLDAPTPSEDQEQRIRVQHVRIGLNELKTNLHRSLGPGMSERYRDIEAAQLFKALKDFKTARRAESDRIILILMQCEALIEYNGETWHRAHPLMLEALEEREAYEPSKAS